MHAAEVRQDKNQQMHFQTLTQLLYHIEQLPICANTFDEINHSKKQMILQDVTTYNQELSKASHLTITAV